MEYATKDAAVRSIGCKVFSNSLTNLFGVLLKVSHLVVIQVTLLWIVHVTVVPPLNSKVTSFKIHSGYDTATKQNEFHNKGEETEARVNHRLMTLTEKTMS